MKRIHAPDTNAAGQPDDEYLGNGLLQSWHHDARGRLIKVDVEDPAHPDYSNWRMDLDINYLPDSDVAGLVDNLGGSGQNQTYTYDALNRLSQWTTSAGLSCGFITDRYGNLSLDATSSSGCPLQQMKFTALNQIQGRIYDADGNLVSDGESESWVWNGENQLAAYQVTGTTQSAQYLYDGLGRRVEKIADGVTTLYLRTALGPVADEVTGSTWTDSVNVPGAERVAVIRGPADGSPGTAATVTWLHADQVGTTRVLTDQNGNNLVQCNQNSYYAQGSLLTYAPFGAELDCTQARTDYKFTGKPRDQESGLDYFGARYNASTLGRFLSPDPIQANALRLINPQRWNEYAYSVNNPTTFTDPNGMDAVAVDFSTMVGGLGHEGIISIHSDGTATYARFGPKEQTASGGWGLLGEPGRAVSVRLKHKVEFGPDKLPTAASWAQLKREAADIEGQDPSTVRMNYFKTTDSEAAALDAWIAEQVTEPGRYRFCTRNCADFVGRGLVAGSAITPAQKSALPIDPNAMFFDLISLAAKSDPDPRPHADVKILYYSPDSPLLIPEGHF